MPKTSELDVIMQQLDALSSAELLAVKARVDALIEGQWLPLGKGQPPLFRWRKVQIPESTTYYGSFSRFTFIRNQNNNVDILAALATINTIVGGCNSSVISTHNYTKLAERPYN
jgi:hypothetical protein